MTTSELNENEIADHKIRIAETQISKANDIYDLQPCISLIENIVQNNPELYDNFFDLYFSKMIVLMRKVNSFSRTIFLTHLKNPIVYYYPICHPRSKFRNEMVNTLELFFRIKDEAVGLREYYRLNNIFISNKEAVKIVIAHFVYLWLKTKKNNKYQHLI